MENIIIVGTGKAACLHYLKYKKLGYENIYFLDNKITNTYIDTNNVFFNIDDIFKGDINPANTVVDICTPCSVFIDVIDNFKLIKKDVTNEEIKEACKLACLDEFIETLPNKYNTVVGEGGVTLSGGQRQRLAIARALVQNTKIILFDEATSALDNETQTKIQKAIDNLKGNYTIIIIAHRLSTIVNCDKIFILEDGKITDSGTHKSLYVKNSYYKKLCEIELKSK